MSRSLQPTVFSRDSDPSVQDSLWYANDFMLGAGMVIIQPSTGKMVILSDQYQDARGVTRPYCFLPKGRKDIGESLEQTALREAYEESGLRVTFMPLIIPTHAPSPPSSQNTLHKLLPSTEPIYIDMHKWSAGHFGRTDNGGEYLTFWYVGQIPENPELEADTRMPDEVGYQTHLVDYDQAMQLLAGTNLTDIVDKAYRLWHATHRQIHNPVWQETVRTKLGIDPASVAAQVPPFPVQNVDEGRRSHSSAEGREDGRTAAR
ncbi:uncharacterized protein TRAVEDRAFT_73057 [Trametes versicolor FP-101664 SS1]|uniref:uncharacterized protein n=1 Tax=Trametes versicolor (strain FP-101664) TaxID=717944 RepID=UPI000462334C|nr:uncharacterized protein TRAVEDRAFT_73057 [Trametes versicolor FP-101664 SS1]EIW56490.1 hypothetical protein TRAVEDRAFT_73057 [Trametes versicolor FP-101664 SS1]